MIPRKSERKLLFLGAAVWLALTRASWGDPDPVLRIALLGGTSFSQLEITTPGGTALVRDAATQGPLRQGTSLTLKRKGEQVQCGERVVAAVWVEPVGTETLTLRPAARRAARTYRGRLHVSVVARRLQVINEVSLEEYVNGVLPSEAEAGWPLEMLKAQAVLIRTYALFPRESHRSAGFDFCDSFHCQVYRGTDLERPATRQAAQATAGQVLLWQGEPVQALYHAVCGGRTTNGEEVFPDSDPAPYLRGVADGDPGSEFCRNAPGFTWCVRLARSEIERALRSASELSPEETLEDLQIAARDESGRVKWLRVVGTTPREIAGNRFRWIVEGALGWGQLKSTWFTLTREGEDFLFEGRGWGHGVGLCQQGAVSRARAGQDYRQILQHYYQATTVGRVGRKRRVEGNLEELRGTQGK